MEILRKSLLAIALFFFLLLTRTAIAADAGVAAEQTGSHQKSGVAAVCQRIV
ncbi:hypothetical protein BH11PSE11_BH11PSE11_26390 [soil metagenome]